MSFTIYGPGQIPQGSSDSQAPTDQTKDQTNSLENESSRTAIAEGDDQSPPDVESLELTARFFDRNTKREELEEILDPMPLKNAIEYIEHINSYYDNQFINQVVYDILLEKMTQFEIDKTKNPC